MFPAKLGAFRQAGPVRALGSEARPGAASLVPIATTHFDGAEVEYRSQSGNVFLIELAQFSRDADAYSCLTQAAQAMRERVGSDTLSIEARVGTANAAGSESLIFYKGRMFVRVTNRASKNNGSAEVWEIAGLLANQIDKGEGEMPVLVKHLPDWETAQKRATYFAGFKSLQLIVPEQLVLSVLDSSGDADAVAADYGSAKLIIVEFNTPQLAGDNDRAVVAKIQELRRQNQAVPAAYRRVGNYGVFVFNSES